SPRVERALHELVCHVGVTDVASLRDRLAPSVGYLGYDVGRGIVGCRASVGCDTGIVDDDPRAVRGEPQRVGAADTAPRARDDGDAFAQVDHAGILGTEAARYT